MQPSAAPAFHAETLCEREVGDRPPRRKVCCARRAPSPAKTAATFPECRILTYGDAAAMRQTVTHITADGLRLVCRRRLLRTRRRRRPRPLGSRRTLPRLRRRRWPYTWPRR